VQLTSGLTPTTDRFCDVPSASANYEECRPFSALQMSFPHWHSNTRTVFPCLVSNSVWMRCGRAPQSVHLRSSCVLSQAIFRRHSSPWLALPRTQRNMLITGQGCQYPKLSSEQLFQRTSWNTLGAEMPIARALGAKAANDLDAFIARRPVSARWYSDAQHDAVK